ncbi:MAG TPA: YfiR family protein [Gemmatimonadales bacterium]|nr:YfiR family protein [Gemmatimonadales bacterium]
MALLTWRRERPLAAVPPPCAALIALAMWLPGPALHAQALGGALEYQVKAAYLLNFTRYVEWPEQAFTSPTAPIDICVLGADPFGGALEQAVAGRVTRGRPLIVQFKRTAAEARYCPVVFVPVAVWRRNPDVLDQLLGHGVLTVGETSGFARAGGIIAFVIEDANVRFVVNLDARDRAGLRISSRMLALAADLLGGGGAQP